MGLEIHSLKDQAERENAMPPPWKADRRVYLNADKTQAVEEGDLAARFLLAAPGQEVPAAVAKQYGLGNETNADLLARYEAQGGDVEALGNRPSKAVIRAAIHALREVPPADPPETADADDSPEE